MRRSKKIIIVIISLIVIIISLTILLGVQVVKAKKIEENIKKVKEQSSIKTKETNQPFKMKLEKNENIVFFGDSITEIYPLEDIYDNYQIINSGISGYKTTDLLEKMDKMLYQYNPTKVILLIGTNDIMKDVSEEKQEETVDNIKKIVNEIKKNRPMAKLYVESLYPVNRNMKKDMVAERTNEAIQNINKNIKSFCNKEKISYINMYDELTDSDGNFDEKYTYDGLHPSTLGFAKITKVLMPYIYE